MLDITRHFGTTGSVEVFGAKTVAVVAISKEKKSKTKEPIVPHELTQCEVAKRIKRQVHAKGGPYWYDAFTDNS